jgi:hypothetical protein
VPTPTAQAVRASATTKIQRAFRARLMERTRLTLRTRRPPSLILPRFAVEENSPLTATATPTATPASTRDRDLDRDPAGQRNALRLASRWLPRPR